MKEELQKILDDLKAVIQKAQKDDNYTENEIVSLKACWADLHWVSSQIDKYDR